VARSLINEPTILLGDEPTGNLDTQLADELMRFVRRANRDHGVTVVIVTHDLDLAAKTDRIVRLKDGQVIADELVVQHQADGASGVEAAARA